MCIRDSDYFRRSRRTFAESHPFAASIKCASNQVPRRIESALVEQPDKALRQRTVRRLLQTGGEGLPEFDEQARTGFDQRGPRQIGR